MYDEVRKDNLYFLATGGGITFGGGEPLLWTPFIKEFRRICGEGWKINIETSLNVPGEVLRSVTEVVDNYIIDIKDIDPDIYFKYTGRDNAKVLENLRYLSEVGLAPRCLVRIPEIPGYNGAGDIARSEALLRGLGFDNLDLFKYDTVKNGERKRNLQDAQGDPPEDRQ